MVNVLAELKKSVKVFDSKSLRTTTSSTALEFFCVSSTTPLFFLEKKSWVRISRISVQKTWSSRTSPVEGFVYLIMGMSSWTILNLLGSAI